MRIYQLGSALGYGDAISNHILSIDRLLRQWGLESYVYSHTVEERLAPVARPDSELPIEALTPDDLLIYHYSVYCDNVDLYRRARSRKILIYHNITPAHFFAPYHPELERLCHWGRLTLPMLRECDLALGDSEFNRQELVAAGFDAARTGVLPILLNLDNFDSTARDERVYRQLRAGEPTTIIFVGRVTPSKAFEDVIKIFAAYHQNINRRSRLWLVGARIIPRYDDCLDRLVQRLGLQHAVTFTNRINLAELKAYYEGADALVCASRHEGFCVPLLEAMRFGVPVLARAETAIPGTLGDAGVMYHTPDYAALAETLALMVEEGAFRRRLIAGQRERLAVFAPERVAEMLRGYLGQVGISLPWQYPVNG